MSGARLCGLKQIKNTLGQKKGKGMFLYSTALNRSSDLHFNPWKTCSFRHQLDFSGKHSSQTATFYAQRLITHISSTVYYQVLIYTAEWTESSWRERKQTHFEKVAKGGFEPGLSRLRVRHSTTELSRFKAIAMKQIQYIRSTITMDSQRKDKLGPEIGLRVQGGVARKIMKRD